MVGRELVGIIKEKIVFFILFGGREVRVEVEDVEGSFEEEGKMYKKRKLLRLKICFICVFL